MAEKKNEPKKQTDDLPKVPRLDKNAPATAGFPPGRGPYKPTP